MSLEVNSLRVAEARHTQTETTSGLILLCMVLLEPGYRVYVYSQNEDNKLQTLDKKEPFKIYVNGTKVGCVFLMAFVSILPRAQLGLNDHREDAPHFNKET